MAMSGGGQINFRRRKLNIAEASLCGNSAVGPHQRRYFTHYFLKIVKDAS